jgi:hypothetical protein
MPKHILVAACLLAVAACTSEPSTSSEKAAAADAYIAAMDAASGAAAAATEAAYANPVPNVSPPRPAHNYDARDGLIYSYIAAISEDERKAGKGAGDVISFAYLGRRNGKHTLAQVNSDGTILGYSSCAQPCTIITRSNGAQIAYNERSIIGGAFADALAGRLNVATVDSGHSEVADSTERVEPPYRPPAQESQPLPSPSAAAGDASYFPSQETPPGNANNP